METFQLRRGRCWPQTGSLSAACCRCCRYMRPHDWFESQSSVWWSHVWMSSKAKKKVYLDAFATMWEWFQTLGTQKSLCSKVIIQPPFSHFLFPVQMHSPTKPPQLFQNDSFFPSSYSSNLVKIPVFFKLFVLWISEKLSVFPIFYYHSMQRAVWINHFFMFYCNISSGFFSSYWTYMRRGTLEIIRWTFNSVFTCMNSNRMIPNWRIFIT